MESMFIFDFMLITIQYYKKSWVKGTLQTLLVESMCASNPLLIHVAV